MHTTTEHTSTPAKTAPVENRRPDRRITGRQITTIVIAGMAAIVLFPTAIWAAAASQVAITDNTTGATATVTPFGAVKIDPTPTHPWFADIQAANGITALRTSPPSPVPVAPLELSAVTLTNTNPYPLGGLLQETDQCSHPANPITVPLISFIIPARTTLPLTFPTPLPVGQVQNCPPGPPAYSIVLQINMTLPSGHPVSVTAVGYIGPAKTTPVP